MSVQGKTLNHSGDNGGRDPPVLIPNTEVKPASADGTWLDTTWESRTLPVPLKRDKTYLSLFFFIFFDLSIIYSCKSISVVSGASFR